MPQRLVAGQRIVPQIGVSASEQTQYKRFFALMDVFRQRQDRSRRAFTLQMALSNVAADLQALDRLRMHD